MIARKRRHALRRGPIDIRHPAGRNPLCPPIIEDTRVVCLNCGKQLWLDDYGQKWAGLTEKEAPHGPYGDNAFCTLRCGYAFGVRTAKAGYRLRADGSVRKEK